MANPCEVSMWEAAEWNGNLLCRAEDEKQEEEEEEEEEEEKEEEEIEGRKRSFKGKVGRREELEGCEDEDREE